MSTAVRAHRLPVWFLIAMVTILIVIINTVFAYRSIHDLSERHQSVINTGKVIVALKDLHQAVLAAESGQRGYLLTQESEYLKYYHQALSSLDQRIAHILDVRTELPSQKQRIQTLLRLIDEKKKLLTTTVDLASNDEEWRARKILFDGRGRKVYENIYEAFSTIEAEEFTLQTYLYNKTMKAQEAARLQIFIFSILSALLIVGIFILQRRAAKKEHTYLASVEKANERLENKVIERTEVLQHYSDELARSNRELEEFAFVASHDLQEPLRKIQAFSDRIERMYQDRLDEKGLDYMARMKNAATRMSSLISDLLEFSRIRTRSKPFVDVDLNDLIDGILDDMEIAIEECGATIKRDKLPVIPADPSQAYQLFLNLLSNAIKFRRADESPVVTIRYQKIEKMLEDGAIIGDNPVAADSVLCHEFTIQDNGVGFAQEFSDKIFMPFQRLHSRNEYKGTGIGLAVCRRIVERHKGTVTASSEVGVGTTFIISLPVEAVDAYDNIAI